MSMRKSKTDNMTIPKEPVLTDGEEPQFDTHCPLSETDVQAIANAVCDKLRSRDECAEKPKEVLTFKEFKAINFDLASKLHKNWLEIFWAMARVVMKLHGLEVEFDENDKIIIKPIYPLYVTPAEVNRKPHKAKKPLQSISILAKLKRGWQRLWADITSCVWKSFAYYVAVLGFGFGLIQWWECSRTTDRVTTELNIIRTVVGSDSSGKQLLNSIDADIRRYGLKETYKDVIKTAEELKRKELRQL